MGGIRGTSGASGFDGTRRMNGAVSRRGFLGAVALGIVDIAAAGAIVGGDYVFCYRMPHALAAANSQTVARTSSTGLWRTKYPDRFSDTPVSTADSYRDKNISITLTRRTYDSGTVDSSFGGSYAKYGSKVSYVLADVYVDRIECIGTAFAQDTYGVGFTEKLSDMSRRLGSILAVNGDSYSNNKHRQNGTIIRNGKVYRSAPATDETCVLYRDGTMRIFLPDELDPKALVADGAWQSWVFGPSLLDAGRAKQSFFTWDYIRRSHPRTAIGYFEPGHYCLLTVDGRQRDWSRGMLLSEMAALFESLGCELAYNLDGGASTFMTFGPDVINSPYSPNNAVSDAIVICDPTLGPVEVREAT